MHEHGLARRIVSTAAARAAEVGCASVKTIDVRLGAWAGIDPDELRHGFGEVAKPEFLADAKLRIEVIQPEARCEDCGAEFVPDGAALRCTDCGSLRVALQCCPELEVDIMGS